MARSRNGTRCVSAALSSYVQLRSWPCAPLVTRRSIADATALRSPPKAEATPGGCVASAAARLGQSGTGHHAKGPSVGMPRPPATLDCVAVEPRW